MFVLSPERFDDLTRALGATTSRRQALWLLIGGLAASLLTVFGDGALRPAAAADAKCTLYEECRKSWLTDFRVMSNDCTPQSLLYPVFDLARSNEQAQETRNRQ